MVLATYYHDNGQVAQIGYFLNGKLHGEWQMFDAAGNKTAMGHYANGNKIGKWYFYESGTVKEVEFADNAIASVVTKEKADPVVVQ
jgi:antitoxin component YwqK of YwqJK toxin-antitoxin module